jgi:hypothetical protein
LAVFRSGDASACTAAETLARTAVSRSLKVFSQTGSMFEKVSERKEANECRLFQTNFFAGVAEYVLVGELIKVVVSCPPSSSERVMSRF